MNLPQGASTAALHQMTRDTLDTMRAMHIQPQPRTEDAVDRVRALPDSPHRSPSTREERNLDPFSESGGCFGGSALLLAKPTRTSEHRQRLTQLLRSLPETSNFDMVTMAAKCRALHAFVLTATCLYACLWVYQVGGEGRDRWWIQGPVDATDGENGTQFMRAFLKGEARRLYACVSTAREQLKEALHMISVRVRVRPRPLLVPHAAAFLLVPEWVPSAAE